MKKLENTNSFNNFFSKESQDIVIFFNNGEDLSLSQIETIYKDYYKFIFYNKGEISLFNDKFMKCCDTAFLKKIQYNKIFSENSINNRRRVFLLSFPGSGNHWVRFIFHNYNKIINENNETPINFSELYKRCPNSNFPNRALAGNIIIPYGKSMLSPIFFHGHSFISPFWKNTGDIIFIERHPYDALISYWYKLRKIENHPSFEENLNVFAIRQFPYVATMIRLGRAVASSRIRYEEMKQDPVNEISESISVIFKSLNPNALNISIENSSSKLIKKMETGINVKKPLKEKNSLGERNLPRDGSVHQWMNLLSSETIEYLDSRLSEYDISDLSSKNIKK